MSASDRPERSGADAPTRRKADKGKEKEDSSTITERLSNSGKTMLGSLMAADHQSFSSTTLGNKAAGSSGVTSRADIDRGHASGTGASRSIRYAAGQDLADGSFRDTQQRNDGVSEAFDRFISEAQPSLGQFDSRRATLGHAGATSRSIAKQEADDGNAVFDLLSRPDVESDWITETQQEDYLTETDAARLRAALFSNSPHNLSWDRLLNFSPNFTDSSSETPTQVAAGQMGTPDVREAEKLWLQQWSEVLSSYNDEVWGDLGQLVAEARNETAEQNSRQSNGNPPVEGKALARLRQILAHVRGVAQT